MQFLREGLGRDVFAALVTRAGGEAIPGGGYWALGQGCFGPVLKNRER